jgi:triacylglycerol lipase
VAKSSAAKGKTTRFSSYTGPASPREQNWGWNYWDALPELGFEVCWVQLPDLALGDIQTSSEYVARAMEVMHARTGESIDVLGHSPGGL